MKSIGTSDSYQNGNLKIMIYFAKFLGSDTNLYEIHKREQIIAFLDIEKLNIFSEEFPVKPFDSGFDGKLGENSIYKADVEKSWVKQSEVLFSTC
jgi:hypothetical protein